MTWFKVDDGFYTSRKVLSIPRTHRLAAVGLWTMAGTWCAGELNDGVVPAYVLEELGATPRLIGALVDAGLWVDHGVLDGRSSVGGASAEPRSSLDRSRRHITFHSWAEYQPTRERVEENREKEREKKRLARERRSGVPRGVPEGQDGESLGESVLPDPTRPDPTDTSPNGEVMSAAPTRPDVDRLLDLLDAEIAANGARVPARTKKNRDAMRLLLDRDGRSEEQVAAAIRWAQASEFWRSNILSASKLRVQYETLRLQAQRERSGGKPGAFEAGLSLVQRAEAMEQERGQIGA